MVRQKYWGNVVEELLRAIALKAQLDPDRRAMGSETESITYGDLLFKTRCLATALITEFSEGTVALSSLIGIERLIAELGCLWAGRTFVPLTYSEDKNQEVARRCAVNLTIGSPIPGWSNYSLDELLTNPPLMEPAHRDEDTAAWITTTSGSTGPPKCIPKSGRHCAVFSKMLVSEGIVYAEDVVATFGEAWQTIELASLIVGATIEVFDLTKKGSAGLSDSLEARGITNVHTYTAMFRLILASRAQLLPKLQTVCLFGEPLTGKELSGFNRISPKGTRLINGYGSSEIGLISKFTYPHGDPISEGPISVGSAFPNVIVEITDPSGAKISAGQVGEIVVRSQYMPAGYIGIKSDAFVKGPSGFDTLRTGDIGTFDQLGNLTVLGRLDDMVKIRGTQVLLKDVQLALESHPSINEAMVTSYHRSDGEPRLCAHLVGKHQISLTEVVRFLKTRNIEAPSTLFHYGILPRTRSGKVDRRALAQPQGTETLLSSNENELTSIVRAVWSTVIRQDDFHADSRLEDIGGDSLDAMRILLLLEEKLGRKIRLDEAMFDGFSLNNLTRILSEPASNEHATVLSTAPSERTIFVLPTGDGHIAHMVPLLNKISSTCSVMAIRIPSLSSEGPAISCMSKMGQNAAQTILGKSPANGAILVGFSFGAILAFETARHLQNADYQLGGLILLDPPAPWLRIMPIPRSILGPLINQGNWDWARRGIVSLLGGEGFEDTSDAQSFAWRSYRAKALKHEVFTLIVAASDARPTHVKEAWRSVIGDQLEVINVLGDHTRFLQPPLDPRFVDDVKKWIETRQL